MYVCMYVYLYLVGKQLLAENPLSASNSYANNVSLEHAYEGVQLEDHELIVIPTSHSDAANTIAMKGNIVKDYHKLKQTADMQAKLDKDAIAAKLAHEIHDQQYQQYLRQKEAEILAASREESVAHIVNNVQIITPPLIKPVLHEDDEYNEGFEDV